MTRTLAVASLMLMAFSLESALACSVPFIRTVDNQTVDGQMTAKSGRPCSIRLRFTRGPMWTASIVQRPSNGTVSVGGSNRIIYRSRPGFVGNDAFIYARQGQDRYNSPVTRTVRVAVTVAP
jgi:hypothetical protein